jgi:cytidine deaminase
METKMMNLTVEEEKWQLLSKKAWGCIENARVLGTTRVGSAALSDQGKIYCGCNIEHRFRSHDIHAEVSAISSLVSSGSKKLLAILIVAERKQFTPCGGCMDWIFEIGGPECFVGYQSSKNGPINKYKAKDLMPHYPM